jgi:hypothetical protein
MMLYVYRVKDGELEGLAVESGGFECPTSRSEIGTLSIRGKNQGVRRELSRYKYPGRIGRMGTPGG